MGRLAAHFRYVEHFRNLVILPYYTVLSIWESCIDFIDFSNNHCSVRTDKEKFDIQQVLANFDFFYEMNQWV